MRTIGRKIIAFLLVVTTLVSVNIPVSAAATDASDYGKLLDSYTSNSSTFTLTTSSRLFVVSASEPTGDLLQTVQLVNSQLASKELPSSSALDIAWGPESYAKAGDIVIVKDSSLATEAYKLEVTEKAVVSYADVEGLIYGVNSLIKFFIADGDCSLSGFTAADAPDTKERTVMLDTGRKNYTAEWIKNFIKQISWMGYNTLELHFSEDGGFRADFWDPNYYTDNYSPANDFTWLCGSHVQSWVKDPYRTDPDAGKYLTTAELVDILKTAKEYHIDVIPSFDSPAHMDYITWKFEQNYKSNKSYSFTYDRKTYYASSTNGCINYTGKTGASTPTWPYYTTIDITDGTMAKAFVFALYEDIADFFKEYAGSTDFSIGADEVNLSSGYGIKWSYSAFPGYVNELNRMLNAKGYTCRMFNDFIGSTTYNQNNSTKAVYDFDDNIEIMYWNSDFNPTTGKWDEPIWHVKFFWENNTGSTDNWGDGGRTLYNCIQTNCYYVLRVAASNTSYPNYDARNPKNHNWTFYHSTEESIYNEWYPADISEKGVYTENAADVPAAQLGGAYFLIWNDYASLNTEAEVWNNVEDSTGTSSYIYSLFNRMWSNTIKMWNSDINSTLTYSKFATIRDKFGYFPGFTSCSKSASLPTASTPYQARMADNSELEAALANKIGNESSLYTTESYTAYENAYKAAVSVNNNYASTADSITAAITALKNAEAGLTVNKLTVYYKATVDGSETTVQAATTHTPDGSGNYSVTLEEMEGYKIVKVDGARTFTPNDTNTAGTLAGNIQNGATVVTVWYEKTAPSLDALKALLEDAITEQGKYTDESWTAYVAVRDKAFSVIEQLPDDYTQEDVDDLAQRYEAAKKALVVEGAETAIESIKRMSTTVRLKKPIGLKITTTADVTSIEVNGAAPSSATSSTTTLEDGSEGKLWIINFKAPSTKGSYTFKIGAVGDASVTEDITITVK